MLKPATLTCLVLSNDKCTLVTGSPATLWFAKRLHGGKLLWSVAVSTGFVFYDSHWIEKRSNFIIICGIADRSMLKMYWN